MRIIFGYRKADTVHICQNFKETLAYYCFEIEQYPKNKKQKQKQTKQNKQTLH